MFGRYTINHNNLKLTYVILYEYILQRFDSVPVPIHSTVAGCGYITYS